MDLENKVTSDYKNDFTHYVGISFNNAFRAYYFGVKNIQLEKGDKVVVETIRGMELGFVAYELIPIEKYSFYSFFSSCDNLFRFASFSSFSIV